MINVIILKGRIFLRTEKGLVECKPFTKTHLVKYMGYYNKDLIMKGKDPYIYIYRGKLKKTDITIPGSIYKNNKGDFIFIEHEPDKKDVYHISKCTTLTKKDIAKKLEDPNTYIQEINPDLLDSGDGEIFAPQIRESDDILKRIIKTTLQNMKINIKTLKGKFSNDYDLNNLKSQLIKEGAMSSKYFARWAEILDIEIEVIIRNSPGSNKLRDEVTVIMK